MRFLASAVLAALAFVGVDAHTYFKETFDKDWESRWVVSSWKKNDGTSGQWKLTAGEWYGDKDYAQGLSTSQDARFYSISSKFPKGEVFDATNKPLVFQFSIKFPQKIDCGGGYVKLLPKDVQQADFSGDSPYYVMFGPDICGTSTKKVHVIFNYKGQNQLIKKNIPCESDQLTHVYTLIVNPDQTYEVKIDGQKKESGSLLDDWDFLPAKTIKDPSVTKPQDWIDEPLIDDASDKKPDDWDKTPKEIPDPEASKPEDWDDAADGEWEAPQIPNPEYKGEWKAKRIPNPEYKGKWVHPEIANPAYVEDNAITQYKDIGAVGIEIWQVKAGTIFDDIIVTDTPSEAEALLEVGYSSFKDAEKKMFDDAEKTRLAKEEDERKKSAEATKKKDDEEEDDDDDDDDEDDKKGHDEL